MKCKPPCSVVSLGKSLEELEGPKARERMSDGIPQGNVSLGQVRDRSVPWSETVQTRDVVGEALGVSGPTYPDIS